MSGFVYYRDKEGERQTEWVVNDRFESVNNESAKRQARTIYKIFKRQIEARGGKIDQISIDIEEVIHVCSFTKP